MRKPSRIYYPKRQQCYQWDIDAVIRDTHLYGRRTSRHTSYYQMEIPSPLRCTTTYHTYTTTKKKTAHQDYSTLCVKDANTNVHLNKTITKCTQHLPNRKKKDRYYHRKNNKLKKSWKQRIQKKLQNRYYHQQSEKHCENKQHQLHTY